MTSISIFDIFKVGVGPSSSHTIGPWKAAVDFANSLPKEPIDRIEVLLYGSLSKTGKGHATDAAVQLGLLGHATETVDTTRLDEYLTELKENMVLELNGKIIICNPQTDVVYTDESHDAHPNTLVFTTYANGKPTCSRSYASVGGGFIQRIGEEDKEEEVKLPFPIETGKDLLNHVLKKGVSIAAIVMQNEISMRSLSQVEDDLSLIYETMKTSVYRGCITEGILPGGLNVKRRAAAMSRELLTGRRYRTQKGWEKLVRKSSRDFNTINKWISCFALAVNEENAAMGRIVTSPTNGAAGVVPAVILYYDYFVDKSSALGIEDFLCVAGEIGSLFKKGATISAAVGGCQAEIGVSSAMAAGGLTQAMGGTAQQVLMAAEIAMEHHLGLTCDPIGGLVQIPCIERNAMGAMKAITAANLALSGDPRYSKVDIDTVIQTMWDTAMAMNGKFKETSEGGLAFNLPVALADC
jgi:L-serine dehydratase